MPTGHGCALLCGGVACAWCGVEAGWIEFDPTNAVHAGADHILVARGRDYGDVAPVKGILRIAGDQTTEHAVDVVPVPA